MESWMQVYTAVGGTTGLPQDRPAQTSRRKPAAERGRRNVVPGVTRLNLTMLLDMAADGFGDRVIIGRRSDGYSAPQLQTLSAGGARLINRASASCLIYLHVNGPAFPAALFAAARAGVPLLPVNYRLSDHQLRRILADYKDGIAIASPQFSSLLEDLQIPAYTTEKWLSEAQHVTGDLAHHDDPGQPAVILYTSGTSGNPRAVLLRHDHLLSYVLDSVEFGQSAELDTALISVPPYHIAAVANVLTNLYAGRRYVFLEQFDSEDWLELVRAEKVTHALLVPTMLARIMSSPGNRDVPSLRSLAYGGAPMPLNVVQQAISEWPHVGFINAYGLTETSSTISLLGPDEHRIAASASDPAVRAQLSSVGKPLDAIEVQIRAENGALAPPGVAGTIWVRGPQVSGEYARAGSALDDQGYFNTRDNGYLDSAGYLFVRGRVDDTIIRGGENIAPAEIEDAILAHDDVVEAVVVGIADPEWGQRIEAVVVPRPGRCIDPEELLAQVRHALRGSKTPDRVLVWSELPRTDTGKIVRREVRARIECETSS